MPAKNAQRIKWFEENTEVKEWIQELERRSKASAKTRFSHLFRYFMWLKNNKGIASARQLLDHFKQLEKGKEYEHNDWAKEYLLNEENRKKSLSWREGAVAAIRGFYRFNRCPLPSETIDLRVREVDAQKLREKASLKTMTLEDFKKLIGPAKIREKSMLLTMLQSGMGVGELVHQFNVCTCDPEYVKKHGHICVNANVLRQLRQGKHPIKIHPLIAFKRHGNDTKRTYFTFLGKDAIETIRQYLVFRKNLVLENVKLLKSLENKREKGQTLQKWEKNRIKNLKKKLQDITTECREGEPIYITNALNPIKEHSIQMSVSVLKKQSGLLDRKFTPHICRDIFKTECDHAGVKDNISEFWIRHALDKYGYNQLDKMHPEDFEREYAKVEPVLNVLSGVSEASLKKIGELENKIEKKSVTIEALSSSTVTLKQKLSKLEEQLGKLWLEMIERQKEDIVRFVAWKNPDEKEMSEFMKRRRIDRSLLEELMDELQGGGCIVKAEDGLYYYLQKADKMGYGWRQW